MSDVKMIITYIFVLSLILILVAYYAGVKTDAASLSGAVNSLIQTSTGRNANNQFAGYPGGYTRIG